MIKNFLLLFVSIFYSLAIIYSEGQNRDAIYELESSVIAIISCVCLFSYKNRPFSLYKVFYIFILFFFCLAPIIQYKDGFAMLGTVFSVNQYREASFYVLLIIVLYNFLYRKFCSNRVNYTIKTCSYNLTTFKLILLLSISLSVMFYYLYYNNFNLMSLLFRGGEFVDRIQISQVTFLLTSYFLRPITLIIFLMSCQMRATKVWVFIFGILFLVSSPPTGMARFSAAALYIPVLLYFFSFFRRKNVFVVLMFFGLLVVFPLLGNLRNFGKEEFQFSVMFEQFKSLNFDSFSMLMRVLDADIVTWGKQLFGVLLFWIPRSLWPSKPIGSGSFIANENNLSFSNISMPYFGEAYINGGIIGIVLFLIFIAWFTAKEDNKYWIYISRNENDINQIKYFLILGLLMFILRGDLLSSFAYLCGFLSAFFMVKFLVSK